MAEGAMEVVNNTPFTLVFDQTEGLSAFQIAPGDVYKTTTPVTGGKAFVLAPKVCTAAGNCYIGGQDTMGGLGDYISTGAIGKEWPETGYYVVSADQNPPAAASKIECGRDMVCDLSAVDGFNFQVRMDFSCNADPSGYTTLLLCNTDCLHGIRTFYQGPDVEDGRPVLTGCTNTSNNGNFDFSRYHPACYDLKYQCGDTHNPDPSKCCPSSTYRSADAYPIQQGPTSVDALVDSNGNCPYSGAQNPGGGNAPMYPAFDSNGKCNVAGCVNWQDGVSCCGTAADAQMCAKQGACQDPCFAPMKSWCAEVWKGQENNKFKTYCYAHSDAAGSPPLSPPYQLKIVFAQGGAGTVQLPMAGTALNGKGVNYSIMRCNSADECGAGFKSCAQVGSNPYKTCNPTGCFAACSQSSDCSGLCSSCQGGKCVPPPGCPPVPDPNCKGVCPSGTKTGCSSGMYYRMTSAGGCSKDPWASDPYCKVP
jgi:hypothetical protein